MNGLVDTAKLPPCFRVVFDRPRRMLRLELEGYWSLETMEAFERERRAVAREVALTAGDHVCLADLRRHAVQSQAVAARAREVIERDPIQPSRIALVVASALAKAQLSRIVADRTTRVFDDIEEAEQWLTTPA